MGSPRSTCRRGQTPRPPPSPPQTTTTAMRTTWWTPARPRRSTKSPPGSRGPALWRCRRPRATGCTSERRPGPPAHRHHCQCSMGQVRPKLQHHFLKGFCRMCAGYLRLHVTDIRVGGWGFCSLLLDLVKSGPQSPRTSRTIKGHCGAETEHHAVPPSHTHFSSRRKYHSTQFTSLSFSSFISFNEWMY